MNENCFAIFVMSVFDALSGLFRNERETEILSKLDSDTSNIFSRLFIPKKEIKDVAITSEGLFSIIDIFPGIFSDTSKDAQYLNSRPITESCDGLFECLGESIGQYIGTVEEPSHKAFKEDVLDDLLYDSTISNMLLLMQIVVTCFVIQRIGSKITGR